MPPITGGVPNLYLGVPNNPSDNLKNRPSNSLNALTLHCTVVRR